MTQPLAVFRADGTARLGLGHLVRCTALADALGALGWGCAFAVSIDSAAVAAPVIPSRWAVITLPDAAPDAEAQELAHRLPEGCDLLIVDHYGRDRQFEHACRGWADRILVIDDLADRAHDCDILIDQTPGRDAGAYAGLVPGECRVATGIDHALLRPQFRQRRAVALARREAADPPHRLLLSLGGTDAADLTSRVIDAAAALPLTLDVVMGTAAPHLAAVQRRAGDTIRVHTGVDDIGALMAEADLAVGAAGMSAWERCCLGLPSLVLVAADNQRPGAQFLVAAEAALVIDNGDAPPIDAIAVALRRLIDDADLRRTLARQAAALCDGRGALRAVLTLPEPLSARDGGSVALRLAEPGDAMPIYDWQCAPETRRYARQPAVPTLAEHLDWFGRTLDDPDRLLTVITHDGAPAGILRFDRLDTTPSFEISIAVAPGRHGLGIGAAALRQGQALMPGARLVAEVDPANTASQRLFESVGFRRIGPRQLDWTARPHPARHGPSLTPAPTLVERASP